MSQAPTPYPMFLLLDGRPALVVGGGAVGGRKAAALLDSGARVTVVAPQVGEAVRALADRGRVVLREREFEEADVEGMAVIVAATATQEVNEAVAAAARRRRIPVNVVDVPDLCDFFVPAVIRRGRLTVAVSSSGAAPGLTRQLARELRELLEPSLGEYLELVEQARQRIRDLVPDDEQGRRIALEAVLAAGARALLAAGKADEARAVIARVLEGLRR